MRKFETFYAHISKIVRRTEKLTRLRNSADVGRDRSIDSCEARRQAKQNLVLSLIDINGKK